MKIANVLIHVTLLCLCCFTAASAQVEITSIDREVFSFLHNTVDYLQSITMRDQSADEGLFQSEALIDIESVVIRSSQSTITSLEATQLAISGSLAVDLMQGEPSLPYGLQGHSSMGSYLYLQFFCDYQLSGVVAGDRLVEFLIIDVSSGQAVVDELIGDSEYDFTGQLAPGNYYVSVYLADGAYESVPVEKHSEVDFELTVALEGTVATEGISLDGIKAIFR